MAVSTYGRSSNNQHRIAVAVEAILFANRLPIGFGNQFPAAKRLHQHQQRRAREMEVRQQRVDRAELERRANEQIGRALPGGNLAAGRLATARRSLLRRTAVSNSRITVVPTAITRPPAARVAIELVCRRRP